MPQGILNQILDQLQILEPSELEQLSQSLQQHLNVKGVSAKQVSFHRSLVESGLVRQIKKPTFERRGDQCLIQTQGESVSQTIVEERR
jgi:hypothetical protein